MLAGDCLIFLGVVEFFFFNKLRDPNSKRFDLFLP